MPDNSGFTRAEKQLLALPVPCLAVGYLARDASESAYAERADLIGFAGPTAIVKERTTKNLRALLRILGAID